MVSCCLYLAGYDEIKANCGAMKDNNYLVWSILRTKKIDDGSLPDEYKNLSAIDEIEYADGGVIAYGQNKNIALFVEQISKYIATVYLRYVSENFNNSFTNINNVDNLNWVEGVSLNNTLIYRKAFPALLSGEIEVMDNVTERDESLTVCRRLFSKKKEQFQKKPGLYCDDTVKKILDQDNRGIYRELIGKNNEILWAYFGCEASCYSLTDFKSNADQRRTDFVKSAQNIKGYYDEHDSNSWWCGFYKDIICMMEQGIEIYEKEKIR